jgi:hypothetical protein
MLGELVHGARGHGLVPAPHVAGQNRERRPLAERAGRRITVVLGTSLAGGSLHFFTAGQNEF